MKIKEEKKSLVPACVGYGLGHGAAADKALA